jgi:hypothetical protein
MKNFSFQSSVFKGATAFILTSVLLGTFHAFAFKGDDPADPKFTFNIDKSTSDAEYLNRDKCFTYADGGVGIGNMLIRVTATTISNRQSSYMASQAFIQTPKNANIEGPVMSTSLAQQTTFSATLSHVASCLSVRFDGYYYSFGWHKAKPMPNDPNKPSTESVTKRSSLNKLPII